MNKPSYFLTLALFAFVYPVCAQDNDGSPATASPFRVGITASADYCNYMMYIYEEYQGFNASWAYDEPYVGYTFGLMGDYALNEHWKVTGGLRFTNHRMATSIMTLHDIYGNDLGTARIIFSNPSIDVPLGIQYETNVFKGVSFISNATITPGVALGRWTHSRFHDLPDSLGLENQTNHYFPENYHYFSLKAEVYAGVGIELNRFQLQILPNARVCLLMDVRDTPVTYRDISVGLEFRLLYSLG